MNLDRILDVTERLAGMLLMGAILAMALWALYQLSRTLKKLADYTAAVATERWVKTRLAEESAPARITEVRQRATLLAELPDHLLAERQAVAVYMEMLDRLLERYKRYRQIAGGAGSVEKSLEYFLQRIPQPPPTTHQADSPSRRGRRNV